MDPPKKIQAPASMSGSRAGKKNFENEPDDEKSGQVRADDSQSHRKALEDVNRPLDG